MRLTFLLIILITISNFLKSESMINSIIDKKLNYNLKFKNISSGHAYIIINEDSLNNNKVLKLKSEIKTNKYLDVFYRIRDDISIYMNERNFSLLKVINKIKEGSYNKNHEATISKDKRNVISKGREKKINGNIYSPLSIIFSLRNEDLNDNDEYYFNSYSTGTLKDITVYVKGREVVKTPYGTFEAILVSPKSNNKKKIFKNNGDMKIWFTNDKNRIPIKIEIKISYGSIILLLDNIK